MYRLRAKRTIGSNPPSDLLFGELAYSDTNKRLYVGRAAGSPATFESDLSLSPITDALADIESNQATQDTAIATLTTELVALGDSQTVQDTAIATLNAASDSQTDAIATLTTNTATALEAKLEADDVASFETTTQLNARDTANRARGNHTGTQTISTIEGLQPALDAKLGAGAIASFETTIQLNARDTANRARGNHTGTQPASTITGLATVATSGAYGDLSGRPTSPYGFTYDQQAEPNSPAVGATWRERSGGGSILGEWEWSGSLWLSNERYVPLYSAVSASANTSAVMSIYPKYPALLTGYSVNLSQPFATQDASNYWVFRHGGAAQTDWLNTIGVSTTVPTFLQKILSTPIVISSPLQSDNFASRVGTPGNLRQFQVITYYKLIR